MVNKIINSFDVWITAQGLKSQGQLKKIGNISLDGIAKLRELILEMAVHGKLVSQDSNDESVETLLEKIDEIKKELTEKGEQRMQKALPVISDKDKPFTIPETWKFVRLGDVTNYGLREQVDPANISGEEWVLELEDVEKITSKLLQRIYAKDRPPQSSRNRFFKGDVIYGKLRPYLDKVIVADADGVCTTEMIPFKGYDLISSEYLRLVMKSPFFVKYASESTHGMNLPRLGTDNARLAVIPIAPTKEQYRIVAKVNELMTICDELEEHETHHLGSHQLLVQTLLGTLTRVSDAAEFQTAWIRLQQHFNDVFTTEDSIDQLKLAILQLAVMGKLVPQDPSDEPSSELLKKIVAVKEKQIKEEIIKRDQVFPPIRLEDVPIKIPKGWSWCRLGDLFRFIDYRGKTPIRTSFGVRLISAKNIRFGYIDNNPIEYIADSKYDSWMVRGIPRNGDILFVTEGHTMGFVAIINLDFKYVLAQRTICLQPPIYDYVNFVFYALMSPLLQDEIRKMATGSAAMGVQSAKLKQLLVPIPPVSEQNRIASKVRELYALCDGLKERISESQKVVSQIADSILEQVV